MAEAGEEFLLDGAVEGVVDALVDGGLDPVVGAGDFADLGDFPGHVVGDAEVGEETAFVE